MTTTPNGGYHPVPGRYDEMVDAAGVPREHWAHLSGAFAKLGPAELLRRRDEAARLIDQDGVVYNAYGDSSRPGQSWLLDPVPTVLSSRDWEALETGVIERAELLNLVLEDLYGPRELLRRGLIAPDVVFSHDGFLRQVDQVRLPGAHQLFSYAVDIGRDSDGRPRVLA
ncbi:MAG TPA: circularly permuted type 2 ATP-grasp protein, partial [Solirubrobacteraceae bacterium]|nr:circularly permuted type 2 ATP-grasp protein [Solirubrobacteraceae bacterium]